MTRSTKKLLNMFVIAAALVLFFLGVYRDGHAEDFYHEYNSIRSEIDGKGIGDVDIDVYPSLDPTTNYIYNHSSKEWIDIYIRDDGSVDTFNHSTRQWNRYHINVTE